MKTLKNLFQNVIFVLMITIINYVNAQEIPINGAFSSDTTFNPFNGEHDVYSFKMTGGITLLSDSSLVRVVLTDHAGNHWLVYEAYPLIDTLNSFSVQDVCDETCFLDKITPDSIRVDLINAIVSIEKFTYDLNEIQNVRVLQEQQKWVNDSIKIAIINQRIQQENMYWRAGRSYFSQFSFSEKEKYFHKKFNAEGYDLYKGGIFKLFSSNSICDQTTSSNLLKVFDWRGKHGANVYPTNEKPSPYYNWDGFTSGSPINWGWLTKQSTPAQGSEPTCWAFSAIALQEAYANLYYNNSLNTAPNTSKHQIDLERSVMEIVSCISSIGTFNCTTGGPSSASVLGFLINDFRHKKSCLGYNCSPQSSCPTNWNTNCDLIQMWHAQGIQTLNEESFKESLILYGPISCEVKNYPLPSLFSHQMLLVGYKVIQTGDILYSGNGSGDPPIIADENCPYIGTTKWYFKDSQWPNDYLVGPINISFGTDPSCYYIDNAGNCEFFYDEITKQSNAPAIKCSDEDGDGYYWWGIHWKSVNGVLEQVSPQQCGCPLGVKVNEEDCDDNNIHAGPYKTNSSIPPQDSLLYSCQVLDCSTGTSPVSLSTTNNPYDWSKDLHINNSLIIKPDYTLTITNQVFFTPGAKIYIAPRARLLLQGTPDHPAKLSSSCDHFWGGIEIGGNPFESQDPYALNSELAQHQGTVTIDNGIIEKAECGIKTLNPEIIPGDWPQGGQPMCCSTSGGIIQATNAIFRNNRIGVEFYPYKWSNGGTTTVANRSGFYSCTFTITDKLLQDAKPQYLLKLEGVNAIPILSCTFNNLYYSDAITHEPYYNDRGNGIYSYNSLLNIGKAPNSYKSRIENLKYGIYAMASGLGTSSVNLHDIEFSGNKYGSYFSGFTEINPFEIKNNNFRFTWNFEGSTDTAHSYGLYLNDCSGFNVSLNTFNKNGCPGSGKLIGIIVNNSGPKTNYIYNNKEIQGLTTGLQSQNINRGSYILPDNGFPYPWPIETGLRFVCNDFTDCTDDMSILEDINPPDGTGITLYQRNIESAVGTQQPAGNTFSPDHLNQNPDPLSWTMFDINIDLHVGNILYKHHVLPTSTRLKPEYISNPKVSYEPYSTYSYDKATSCPDIFPTINSKEELELIISQSNFKIDSLTNLLQNLTDNGSTDTLKNIVDNSTPNQSYNVYQDLINASPFLSDTVLKSSIIKEDVLPNSMIRDVMVANPQSAKSSNLLNALENRYNPMPDSMWAEILDGRDTIGAMEQLKSELSGWIQLRDIYFNVLIKLYLQDTINEVSGDSLVTLLQNDFNLISRYNLVSYYLEKNNFTQAENTLQNILNDFTLSNDAQRIFDNFTNLLPVLEQLVNDTVGYNNPDSSQISVLQGLLTNDYNLPGAYARNILIATGLLNYQEPILIESTEKSSRYFHHSRKNININSEFKVYPNPCKDYLIVEYLKGKSSVIASCKIFNTQGNSLATYYLNRASNQVIIPFTTYPPGNYFIQFKLNGINKSMRKVVKVN